MTSMNNAGVAVVAAATSLTLIAWMSRTEAVAQVTQRTGVSLSSRMCLGSEDGVRIELLADGPEPRIVMASGGDSGPRIEFFGGSGALGRDPRITMHDRTGHLAVTIQVERSQFGTAATLRFGDERQPWAEMTAGPTTTTNLTLYDTRPPAIAGEGTGLESRKIGVYGFDGYAAGKSGL